MKRGAVEAIFLLILADSGPTVAFNVLSHVDALRLPPVERKQGSLIIALDRWLGDYCRLVA